MQNVMEPDLLDEISERKSLFKLKIDPTRALELKWDLLFGNTVARMVWPPLGFSEASLGLLGSVSWAAHERPQNLGNVRFVPMTPPGGPPGPKILPILG